MLKIRFLSLLQIPKDKSCNILSKYGSDATTALDLFTHDQGEDRWLTTLLVLNGWSIHYCSLAKAFTACPATVTEVAHLMSAIDCTQFFKQRKRWITSTLFNLVLVMAHAREIVSKNSSVGWGYIAYTILLLISSVLSPGTIILLFATVGWHQFYFSISSFSNFAFNFPSKFPLVLQLLQHYCGFFFLG